MRRLQEEDISGIYKISIGNYTYIGASKCIWRRWKEHLCGFKRQTENKKMLWAWNLIGKVELSILECCSVALLHSREQYYIDKLEPELNVQLRTSTNYKWI